MTTPDHKYIWHTMRTSYSCVFIPSTRTIVVQRCGDRVFWRIEIDRVYPHYYYVPTHPLHSWWYFMPPEHRVRLLCSWFQDKIDHTELLTNHGPIAVDQIYRYDRCGIYTSRELDKREQRRLIMFTLNSLSDL